MELDLLQIKSTENILNNIVKLCVWGDKCDCIK